MILSRKIQIDLSEKEILIISVLLGLLEIPNSEEETSKHTQSVFYHDEIKKLGEDTLRLEFSPKTKENLRESWDIYDNYLLIQNPVIAQVDNIVKVKLQTFLEKRIELLLLFEVEEKEVKFKENRLLSIYLSEFAPITAFDSGNGNYFVDGLDYLEQLFHFVNEIERLWNIRKIQENCENPKPTKRITRLMEKSNNVLTDIIHKLTRKITNYCVDHKVSTVLIGKAKEISVFPIKRFIHQLKYKLKLEGINLVITNGSGGLLNFNKLPEETKKLEKKIKQKWNWNIKAKENRNAAFNLITNYLEETDLDSNISSLAL